MAEKELVLDTEDQDQDLQSIQTLLRQHEALEVGNNSRTHWQEGVGVRTIASVKVKTLDFLTKEKAQT